jgi:hypothetical protein
MTKEELLAKIKERPKKAQLLIRWHYRGAATNPQTMIYSGHDENGWRGIRPFDSGTLNAQWSEAQFIIECTYFRPDITTRAAITSAEKFPSGDDRYVGIEMEIISKMDHYAMRHAIAQAGLESYVCAKSDGSVRGSSTYPNPHELAILVKESEMARVVKKVCKILHGNSSVNKSCGLHVHLDMRKRNSDVAYANLYSAQALLYAMCPKTRLTNSYCRPQNSYTKMSQAHMGGERYLGINPTAFARHKTIEIRIHSGTINAFKIINWVKLLIQIADKPDTSVDGVRIWRNYKDVRGLIGLRGMLEKYVSSRIEEFSEDHEDSNIKLTA